MLESDFGIRRTGTGVALRAVAADEAAADDLLSAGHRELLDALLQDATAANTTRTYRSPVQRFKAWCAEHGYRALPAEPVTVAAFLAEVEAERDGEMYRYPASTLGMWAAAIRRDHLDADYPDPVTAPVVRKALASIAGHRTDVGQVTERAEALLAADLQAVVDSMSAQAAEGDWKIRLAAVRDTALIVVGFYSARRRSEIARINFGDLRIVTDDSGSGQQWIRMRIRGSKTSRTTVEYVHLPRSSDPRYCPWCRLMDWLMLVTVHDNTTQTAIDRGDTEDQQFRAARQAMIRLLDKLGDRDIHLHQCDRELPFARRATAPVWRALVKKTRYLPVDTGHPITDQTIPRVLKKRCREAGFDPARIARISGHSLRAGFITQARADSVASEDIRRQSGHKKIETIDRYYDRNPGYRNNAVNQLPL
jgi:integrase